MIDYTRVIERTEELCRDAGAMLRSRQARALIKAIVEAVNEELGIKSTQEIHSNISVVSGADIQAALNLAKEKK